MTAVETEKLEEEVLGQSHHVNLKSMFLFSNMLPPL